MLFDLTHTDHCAAKGGDLVKLDEIAAGSNVPRLVNAVIEIPRGGRVKYEYDPVLGIFRVDRVLSSAVQYPAAYGFIPSTLADDGDATDILVMVSEPTVTGCLLEARPVGVLLMRDEKGEDEKILAVAAADHQFDEIQELDHVATHFRREVEHFFRTYKDLDGKHVETFGWGPRPEAGKAILAGVKNYRKR